MTFGLISWLKSIFRDLNYEVPVWYPSRERLDTREWMLTNGIGGYSSATLSGAHTRRYHALLVAALNAPRNRHIVLSKADEILTVNGIVYKLGTNIWDKGVVSPPGYRNLESFTYLPSPTWVFEIDGHYLIKQLALDWHSNDLHIAYWWLPDRGQPPAEAKIEIQFLTAFRYYHDNVDGDTTKLYQQLVAPEESTILLNDSGRRLCLNWNKGEYRAENQWWWNHHWPEESARATRDSEDLFLAGTLTSRLKVGEPLLIGASLDKTVDDLDIFNAVQKRVKRQRLLIEKANLPRSHASDLLVLACSSYLVSEDASNAHANCIIEGFPWFADSGRAEALALPGLTLATHRYEDAKQIIINLTHRIVNGLAPNLFLDTPHDASSEDMSRMAEYGSADVTLWLGWALYQFYLSTQDKAFVGTQLPLLMEAADHYIKGTNCGLEIDPKDGLLRCSDPNHAYSWFDKRVAGMPLTPRLGKPVELSALWYNFLSTLIFLAEELNLPASSFERFLPLADLCKISMQKFWNEDALCLFDVFEKQTNAGLKNDESVRPNQLIAVSLPFRAMTKSQERSILMVLENALLTPYGLRSLSADDPSYTSRYGCGFSHADQYHRDLSYEHGVAWPWLLGQYCDAFLNVKGESESTYQKITELYKPLLEHFTDDGCLGQMSECFDGSAPQLPHGAFAYAPAVAETIRIMSKLWRAEPTRATTAASRASR